MKAYIRCTVCPHSEIQKGAFSWSGCPKCGEQNFDLEMSSDGPPEWWGKPRAVSDEDAAPAPVRERTPKAADRILARFSKTPRSGG